MPGKHNAGGCGCCGECSDNDSARVYLLASLGLSTITASGGPVVSASTPDWKQLTCFPYPDGSTDPDYPTFDFSGSTSSAISSTPAGAGYIACPPNFSSGQDPYGALDHACVSGSLNVRGFGYRSGVSCPSYLGALSLDYYASFRATVTFTCTAGVASYVLGISTSLILFVRNPTGYFASLPTIGADWTRTGSGHVGLFTKVGSTATDGAFIDYSFVRSAAGGSVYAAVASTYVSNPTTSVTMWVPDPVIDWTALTHVGTAALS